MYSMLKVLRQVPIPRWLCKLEITDQSTFFRLPKASHRPVALILTILPIARIDQPA